MAELPLDKVRCEPAGSVATALDVNIDTGARHCGMCQRDLTGARLGMNCPHCGHQLGWFQLLTDCTALGDQVSSERALAAYIRRYKKRQAEEDARGGWMDGPDDSDDCWI
jgi:hypothetical protein